MAMFAGHHFRVTNLVSVAPYTVADRKKATQDQIDPKSKEQTGCFADNRIARRAQDCRTVVPPCAR